MKLHKFISSFLLVILFGVQFAFACEAPNSNSYPPLSVNGGWIIFNEVELPDQKDQQTQVMGLGISYADCSSRETKLISRLPYLTDLGKIQDAFMWNIIEGQQELFVIHSVPIRSATGMGYASDYYSVLAFSRNRDNFMIDQALSDYLGRGADVIDINSDDDKMLYVYPYKTKNSITTELSSSNYKEWKRKEMPERIIAKKATIYSSQSMADATKMYLVPGDRVRVEDIAAGWLSVRYITAKKSEIRGWILCSNVKGC